jgi:hypothetical protein
MSFCRSFGSVVWRILSIFDCISFAINHLLLQLSVALVHVHFAGRRGSSSGGCRLRDCELLRNCQRTRDQCNDNGKVLMVLLLSLRSKANGYSASCRFICSYGSRVSSPFA